MGLAFDFAVFNFHVPRNGLSAATRAVEIRKSAESHQPLRDLSSLSETDAERKIVSLVLGAGHIIWQLALLERALSTIKSGNGDRLSSAAERNPDHRLKDNPADLFDRDTVF